MAARRHEMTEELNDGNAVADINVIAKVPSVHECAVPLALLEGFALYVILLLLDASRAQSSRAHCGTAATAIDCQSESCPKMMAPCHQAPRQP